MFCTNCGTRNDDSARFCGVCGAKMAGQFQAEPQKVEPQVQNPMCYPQWQMVRREKTPGMGLGIAGLVMSLVALVLGTTWLLSVVFAVLGIVFSAVAMAKAKKVRKSNGLAVGGLICGIVAIVIVAIYVIVTIEMVSGIPDPGLGYSVYM